MAMTSTAARFAPRLATRAGARSRVRCPISMQDIDAAVSGLARKRREMEMARLARLTQLHDLVKRIVDDERAYVSEVCSSAARSSAEPVAPPSSDAPADTIEEVEVEFFDSKAAGSDKPRQ